MQLMIGVHEFEKKFPQRILVDVDVFVALADTHARNDSIEYVFDYDQIHVILASYATSSHIELQETLCDDIIRKILVLPSVVAAKVRTCKPDIYPHCKAVGVERFEFSS
jgi:dihydroneopterin aldolase